MRFIQKFIFKQWLGDKEGSNVFYPKTEVRRIYMPFSLIFNVSLSSYFRIGYAAKLRPFEHARILILLFSGRNSAAHPRERFYTRVKT